MTQGNPYGRAAAPWMTKTRLRGLYNSGLTYDEIAEENEKQEGWRPSRSAVKRKLVDELGFPPRNMSHRDLLPWKIKPEHSDSELRHMLQAESRRRNGDGELSDSDRRLVRLLHDLLFGRGTLMVVSYHPEIGFYTLKRIDADDDIIRRPRADVYSDPGLGQRARAAEQETRNSSESAAYGAAAQTRPSSTR